jgi:hypothetical protein
MMGLNETKNYLCALGGFAVKSKPGLPAGC